LDQGLTRIDQRIVDTVIPGREPNPVYIPVATTSAPTTTTTATAGQSSHTHPPLHPPRKTMDK
jgi:hypothetical protein